MVSENHLLCQSQNDHPGLRAVAWSLVIHEVEINHLLTVAWVASGEGARIKPGMIGWLTGSGSSARFVLQHLFPVHLCLALFNAFDKHFFVFGHVHLWLLNALSCAKVLPQMHYCQSLSKLCMPYIQGCSPGEEYIKHLCFKHYEQLAKEGAKAASLDFRKLIPCWLQHAYDVAKVACFSMPLTLAHLCVHVFKDVRNTGFLEVGIAGPGAKSSSFLIEVSLNCGSPKHVDEDSVMCLNQAWPTFAPEFPKPGSEPTDTIASTLVWGKLTLLLHPRRRRPLELQEFKQMRM